jgi:hypothetical protein
MVTVEGGAAKPIADIEVGDRVLATDPQTGLTAYRDVLAVIVTRDDKQYVDLDIEAPAGDRRTATVSTLTTTAQHPFWNAGAARWVDAGDLRPGDRLRRPDGTTAKVAGVRSYQRTNVTYNLTVDELQTYYVLAGSTPVLVHNCAMKRGQLDLRGVNLPKSYEGLDIAHTRANHVRGGSGVHSGKDLWPDDITDDQLEDYARQALKNGKVVGYDPDTRMIQGRARVNGLEVQFQVPRGGGMVRSVYRTGR